MTIMTKQLRPAIAALIVFTIITGVIYPLFVTAVAQIVFPAQTNGSLIVRDGNVVGSSLIGQNFDDPKYFWGRLSATGPFAYNSAASSGSNYGPLNPALIGDGTDAFKDDEGNPITGIAKARIDALKAADPSNTAPIPVDLVTASASGLDPHISPGAAQYQISRVAAARGLSIEQVQQLVAQHTEGRTLGILGEPRVNVLQLNLALDATQ